MRTLRKGSQRQKRDVSSAYYVGYVEDYETPEMIMKKFEELERMQAAMDQKQLSDAPATPVCRAPLHAALVGV